MTCDESNKSPKLESYRSRENSLSYKSPKFQLKLYQMQQFLICGVSLRANQVLTFQEDGNLVDINHRRKLKKYKPFVLAIQAAQVYYATYPSLRRDKSDWWAVCKTKGRDIVDMPPSSSQPPLIDILEPFQCDEDGLRFNVVPDNEIVVQNYPNGEFINLRDEDDDLDDWVEFMINLNLMKMMIMRMKRHIQVAVKRVKANNEFVDMKSKSTYDAVVSKIASASQPVDESVQSPPIDFSRIYMDKVGGIKKACIYGLGSQAVYYKNVGPSSASTSRHDLTTGPGGHLL